MLLACESPSAIAVEATANFVYFRFYSITINYDGLFKFVYFLF